MAGEFTQQGSRQSGADMRKKPRSQTAVLRSITGVLCLVVVAEAESHSPLFAIIHIGTGFPKGSSDWFTAFVVTAPVRLPGVSTFD
jgi:hypothetical protein